MRRMATLTADERLAGPLIKAKRAEFHILNVEAEIGAFLSVQPEPYGISAKHDPQSRKLIYYISKVTDPPASLSATIGDALCSLRAALDHLAQQFYFVGTGSSTPSWDTCFPILERCSAAEYKTKSKGHVVGMRDDAKDFLFAAQPYNGGNKALLTLRGLNNIDKHRLLIATGGFFGKADIGPHVRAQFQQMLGKDIGPLTLKFNLSNPMCPLKVGDELFIDAPDAKFNPDQKFEISISLNEPQIIEPKPVLILLRDLSNTVNGILNLARPHLV
jgi:hypothetical protein